MFLLNHAKFVTTSETLDLFERLKTGMISNTNLKDANISWFVMWGHLRKSGSRPNSTDFAITHWLMVKTIALYPALSTALSNVIVP